jgi:hypothetical protein
MANPNPSPATRFKTGNTFSVGNGRPHGSSIRARIRALAAQDTGDGKTIEDRLAEKFILEALKGKHPFAHDVLEAIDGKLTERVEINGADGGPIIVDATVREQAAIEFDAWRQKKLAEISERPSRPPTVP